MFNGPTCIDHPLPRNFDKRLPKGTLLAGVHRTGRTVRIATVHSAKIVVVARVRGRLRRVARRHLAQCASTAVTLPKGTRLATVTAFVGKRFERRSLHLR